jgi:hypothetical protein
LPAQSAQRLVNIAPDKQTARLHFLDHKKLQNHTTPRGTPSVHSNLTDSDPPALAVLHPARRDGGGDQQP